MKTTKTLLELRKKMNAKRPRFIHPEAHKRKEVPQDKWRRPKGMHSAVRHQKWGRRPMVTVGYRGPLAARYLAPNGLSSVLVYTLDEVNGIDKASHCAIIGHVGGKRKVELIEACQKKGITILNVKKPQETVDAIKKEVAVRKEQKKQKPKPAAPVKKETKQEPPAATPTKEEARKEMEKVITKREA